MRYYSNHQFKWISNIKNILNSTGNSDLWLNQNNITTKNIHKIIKQNLLDTFKQNWNTQSKYRRKGSIMDYLKIMLILNFT